MIWGGVHGLFLVADRACWLRWQQVLPDSLNTALTFLLISLTWVFFRCPEFAHALDFFRALAGATPAIGNRLPPEQPALVAVVFIGLGLVFLRPLAARLGPGDLLSPAGRRVLSLTTCGVLLFLAVGRMAVSTFQPFLYFRF